MRPTVPILVGPTASGKTALVVRMAEWVPNVEVISADSRQVYRMLDIGTAQPSPEERTAVPHHLVGFLDPAETYSAGRFRADAERTIAACLRRHAFPIVAGGTGLYLRALTKGLSPIPHVPDEVNRRLRDELAAQGLPGLYRRLEQVDRVAAAGIEPNDAQRVLRALAVHEATGRPLSKWWDEPAKPPEYDYAWLGIRWPREQLRERILRRTRAMVDAGLEREVRGLLEHGYTWQTPALRTVGYREWRPYFEGTMAGEEVASRIVTNTRRYAKRQMTWFNAVQNTAWLDGDRPDLPDEARRWLKSVGAS